MLRILLIIFFSIMSVDMVAQNLKAFSAKRESYDQELESRKGELSIYQDSRLETLILRHIEFNKKQSGISGFRIQIFFDSGQTARNNAYEAKAKLLSYFPDEKAYIIFQSPFYKVRVGDFRSKIDALKIFRSVVRKFPNAYIIPDMINFPDLD
jgi:hypothetical protein